MLKALADVIGDYQPSE